MPRWPLLASLTGLTLLLLVACQTVPITGRSQLQLLPESEGMRMGLQAYQEILRKSRISHDPALNDLVTRVGRRIAEATGRRDLPWEFKVVVTRILRIEQWLPEALQYYQASPHRS